MTTQNPGVQITGAAPLYKRPEPLNPQDHGKLGLKKMDNPYSVANDQHFVPLLVNEFGAAACNYPIAFAGDDKTPIAVLGLRPGENLFSGEAMQRGEVYAPAYVRRYPFTVANAEGPEEDGRAIICIDRDSPLIGENPDEPFYENGAFTQYTQNCIQFCQNFENDRILTTNVIKRLKDLDVFEHRTVEFRKPGPDGKPGEPQIVAGFFAISQTKLNALPVETYIALRDQGVLTAIFAHWMSQWHWDRMVARAIAQRGGENLASPIANDAGKPKGKKPN